jgi:hypothetical protein
VGASVNIQSYVDLGWSVFPVKGPAYGKDYKDTKKPILDTWKPYQSRKPTPEEVADWLKRFPKSSVGAPTGPINGIFVVDIDSNAWQARFPDADFGTTWKSTSKRGCHYFYKWQDWMHNIKTTGTEIGKIDGFDIRGEGGYVVLPNENDPERKWNYAPTEGQIEILPKFLREFFEQNVSRSKSSAVVISEITEGNRHSSFLALTGKLHRAGLEPAEIIQILAPTANATGFGPELVPLVQDVVTRYPIERRKELNAESVEALLLEPEPPLEWLIEGLWVDKAKGFIAGHPGVGKTWIALDMLISVATGGMCMGKYKPSYKAPCLIIEEEASRRNLQRRIHVMARARGLKPADLSSLFHITQQFSSIPRDGKQITDFVLKHGIKLVVFDSLRAVHSAKENSSDDMVPILKSFSEISIAGQCSVVLIHHLSKSNVENASKNVFERMRGTGSLWAWRDCILGIEGEEESDTCKCTFQFRDADSPAPVQIKRCVGAMTGAIGLEASSLEDSEEFVEKTQQVVEYVRTQFGGSSRNQICKVLDGRKQDNLKLLKQMVKKGFLEKSGPKLVVPQTWEPVGTSGTSGGSQGGS